LVSKSRSRELARASANRILPKITLRQTLGSAVALSAARRLPNFMSFVGLPRYQGAADKVVAGSIKSIFKQGGKSLSSVGIAEAASNILEDIVPLASRLLSGGVAQTAVGGVAITAQRVTQD